MRLDRFDLTRYGRFTGTSLTFPAPPAGRPDLHIVYGPNEAGKSTLFSAWLDLLFGIPPRSPYMFRHDGPTMLIGAKLTDAGGTREVQRVKRNKDSLLDAHDNPIPEATVQAALGGLSRESYGSMFSLDKITIEKGGENILASRGDLGEMLLSASAGLAQLTPRLDALRAELDKFHGKGKRSGWLVDVKKQLIDLQRQASELEVSATELRRRGRDAAEAESAWRAARAAEDEVLAKLDRLSQVQGTLPLLDQLARLKDQLAPVAHLPDADALLADKTRTLACALGPQDGGAGDYETLQARDGPAGPTGRRGARTGAAGRPYRQDDGEPTAVPAGEGRGLAGAEPGRRWLHGRRVGG